MKYDNNDRVTGGELDLVSDVVSSTNPVEAYVRRGGNGSARPKPKKVPPALRRWKINFALESVWYKRLLWRLREDSQFLRTTVQFAFVLLCVWIGVEFDLSRGRCS